MGIENPEKSNLTPVTKMVHDTLDMYVAPRLGANQLIGAGNEIAANKLPPEDPKCIDFAIQCRELSTEICNELRAENKSPQEIAIVQNYLNSLAANIANNRPS